MLKELWAKDNLSCRDIAQRLDVTRNAVIGRAHRLDLESRPQKLKPVPVKTKPRKQRAATSTLPPPRKPARLAANTLLVHSAPLSKSSGPELSKSELRRLFEQAWRNTR
jgi:GcrA cell cycle regulator